MFAAYSRQGGRRLNRMVIISYGCLRMTYLRQSWGAARRAHLLVKILTQVLREIGLALSLGKRKNFPMRLMNSLAGLFKRRRCETKWMRAQETLRHTRLLHHSGGAGGGGDPKKSRAFRLCATRAFGYWD